ncbi:MAG: hypothetical protein WC628_06470 [Candidatus Omnitrophota bacterium]
MTKPNPKKAKMHLEKLRKLIAQRKSQFAGMSKEEVIQAIRKTREELWEHKIAFHT